MPASELRSLLLEKLRVLHGIERQLVRTLPRAIRAARSAETKQHLQARLDVSRANLVRIEVAFDTLDAADGLPVEATNAIPPDSGHAQRLADLAMDAGLLLEIRKTNQQQLTGCRVLESWARGLGHERIARLLADALEDNEMTAASLAALSEASTRELMACAQRRISLLGVQPVAEATPVRRRLIPRQFLSVAGK